MALPSFLSRRSAPAQSGAALSRAKVVAVLPFEAIGGKAENQALCRGLTELLTARLAQISKRSGVEVVPSSEVRAQGVSTAEDARKKLGVTLVVEGSWNFAANNQVTYSLVDAQTRRNLNGAVVNADLRNLAAAEREVVDKLLAMLDVEVRPGEAAAVAARPDAYQYYVRGRGYLLDYANPNNLKSAVELFNTAIKTDPGFALAYAALGEAYWRQFQESKDSASIPKAMQACRIAARLNDRLAPVHVTFGLIYQGTGRYEDAVKEFGRALDLDATSDAAYRGLATSYASLEKPRRPRTRTGAPSRCARTTGADTARWAPSTTRPDAMTRRPPSSAAPSNWRPKTFAATPTSAAFFTCRASTRRRSSSSKNPSPSSRATAPT